MNADDKKEIHAETRRARREKEKRDSRGGAEKRLSADYADAHRWKKRKEIHAEARREKEKIVSRGDAEGAEGKKEKGKGKSRKE